jgi:hypothetical protein
MQLSRFVTNAFTLRHEQTLAEARRTKLFAFLLSLAKRENLSAPEPSSVQRTSTTLTELFRQLFVSLNFYNYNQEETTPLTEDIEGNEIT